MRKGNLDCRWLGANCNLPGIAGLERVAAGQEFKPVAQARLPEKV